MPHIEVLRKQAKDLELIEGVDFTVGTYTIRTTGAQVEVLKLTSAGVKKKEQLREQLFSDDISTYEVPLAEKITQLKEGDVITMDGLLALSLIRRRTGGYICSLVDDFTKLKTEHYRARVQHLDMPAGTVRLLFDHWPGEYLQHEYLLEKPNLVSINEPVSIGPTCTVPIPVLMDGKPREDMLGWFKNAVQRNFLGKK